MATSRCRLHGSQGKMAASNMVKAREGVYVLREG